MNAGSAATTTSTSGTQRWCNAAVRDLAWVIGSPPLVRLPASAVLWPDAGWHIRNLEQMLGELETQDKNNWPGREQFAARADQRLGAYFEFLVAHWLTRDKRYQLLESNLPVRQSSASGGVETIGELDLIVRERASGQTEHWEMAIKFYLGGAPGLGKSWVGTGLRDRLDFKLAKMTGQQFPLVNNEVAQAALSAKSITVDRCRAFVKGCFFYPWGEETAPPAEAASEHLRGWWLRRSRFQQAFAETKFRWQILQGLDRMAGFNPNNETYEDTRQFSEALADRPADRAIMVAAAAAGREAGRGFLVPDDWPQDRVISDGDVC